MSDLAPDPDPSAGDGEGGGDRRRGAVHLYDGDGAWSGFFVDEAAAAAWVRTHPGYALSDVGPGRAG